MIPGNSSCKVLACIVLIGITLAVYWKVGNYDFVGFDDGLYVTANPHVASGVTSKNIVWALTSVDDVTGYWLPVTLLSHMTDVQFYGMNPRGHHLTNVVIHTVSTLLLLILLLRLTGAFWRSAFVAALFALHPLHVESVAWVAERKDVLSAFFWFLTLLLYAEYVSKRKPLWYTLSLISFALGLMSKPMLVTLPAVMLLLDFWPLGRFRQGDEETGLRQDSLTALALIKEKIPFFACSLLSGVVTIYAQHKAGAVIGVDAVPLMLRIDNALISYVKYIGLTLWPHDLAILYPFSLSLPLWQAIGALLVLFLVSSATFRARHSFPYLPAGWFWFLVTLLPVIGLIQSGTQSMADRFSYIPSIGLFIVAAWGVSDLAKRLPHRKAILAPLAGVVIIASAALTWQQVAYWEDSLTLFRHTLQVTSGNYLIHNNLGVALDEKGITDEAMKEFQEALRLKPDYTEAHYNLGIAHYKKGNQDEAIREFQMALLLKPDYLQARFNLGLAYDQRGDLNSAIREFRAVLQASPANTQAHFRLGVALIRIKQLDEATHEFQVVLQASPDYMEAHYNLGVALAQKGDLDAAIQKFRDVLRINPDYSSAQQNLAAALAQKKMNDAANK